MFSVPDEEDVVAAATALGLHIPEEEVVHYRAALIVHLNSFNEFVQARIEEDKPELLYPSRAPGYRPSNDEDPLGAWLWKCDIGGSDEGLLAGKTVSYKDHTAVAGVPLTFGSYVMEGFMPDFDATVVTRVLAEGGRIVGKNAMNGFVGGFGFGGTIGDYDRPKNPHNPDHVTGGSSSGSGAALAGNEVDISFGGDQGGSIRIPAAWSGTVGHKPTFGLVSHFGIGFGSDQSIDYTGPMTRTVEDCAAALQAVAGYDGYDPRQGRLVPDHMDVLSGLGDGIAGLRIGVLDEGFHGAEPDVTEAVMQAVDTLASLGANVVKVSVPEHADIFAAQGALGAEGSLGLFQTGFFGLFTRTYYPASLIAEVNKMWAADADLLNPRTKLQYLAGTFAKKNFDGRVYAKAQNVRPTYIRKYDAALADVDVLVMPTVIVKAPRYSPPATYLENVIENLSTAMRPAIYNTQPFNYTGHPALAVPVGKSEGLPVSMQLVGRFFEDPLLMRVAYAFQQAVDWDDVIGISV